MGWNSPKATAAGDRAPEFSLRSLDGHELSLNDMRAGGPVVLVFFKVSCPVCQYTFPFLERLHQSGATGLRFIGISQDNAADTRDFASEYGVTFPVLLDEARYPVSNAFGIQNVPTLFVVEPDGIVSSSGTGFVRRDLEALANRMGAQVFRPEERVPEFRPG